MRYAPVQTPIELVGDPSGVDDVVGFGWVALDGPGFLVVAPGSNERATFRASSGGTYHVAFDVQPRDGEGIRCEVTVFVVEGPPVALCPTEPLETLATLPRTLVGEGIDDHAVVAYQWDLVASVDGAVTSLEPRTSASTTFSADRVGTYGVRLTVYDTGGATGDCLTVGQVLPRPAVECPEGPIETSVADTATLMATVMNASLVTTERWTVIDRPAGSTATPSPANLRETSFTPDRSGDYTLRFTVEDALGVAASCDVGVVAIPPAPVLRCTDIIETTPLSTVTARATLNAGVTPIRVEWTRAQAPNGTAAQPQEAHALVTRFTPDVSGEYALRATVEDGFGRTASCTTRILAYGQEGLRIEMFWNTNGTDMDLHLLHPRASQWMDAELDCYWRNCQPANTMGLQVREYYWGDGALPSLDLDDVDGLGPENINIVTPVQGTYRVGVVSFFGGADVTVRVYCGGEHINARMELGPTPMYGSRQLWRVADVTIGEDGCTVTPLEEVVPFGIDVVPR